MVLYKTKAIANAFRLNLPVTLQTVMHLNESYSLARKWYELKNNGWNTPSDYLSFVHEHWRKFEEPNPMLHHLLGCLYVIFMILSLVGNGIVIYVFLTSKKLRTTSNMFVVNLAVCDFVMMLKTPVFIINSFNEGPIFGHLGCQIYGLLGALSGPGAAVTNAAIAYDRYKCITQPFADRLTTRKTVAVIGLLWAYVLPVALLPFTQTWNRFVPEGYLTSCTFDYMTDTVETRLFVGVIWIWCYVIPLAIVVACYASITVHVMNHEKQLKIQAQKMNVESLRAGDNATLRQEVRVAKVGLTLTSLFLLSWTPYFVVAFMAAYGKRQMVTPFVSMIPAMTCKTAACIDPYIYAINHPRYRQELQSRWPWLCVHEPEDRSDDSRSLPTQS